MQPATTPLGRARGAEEDDRKLGVFRPIKLERAADAVIAVLVDAIRGGIYRPGDLLPRERDLAAQLQVSRNVVREAIIILREAHVLSVKRGQSGGITVRSAAGLENVVAKLRGRTHDVMLQVLELRRALEPVSAVLASQRASDDELASLGKYVTRLEELLHDPGEFTEVDVAFHVEMVRLAKNPLLFSFYNAAVQQNREVIDQFPVLRVDLQRALENQRTLFAALTTRVPAVVLKAVDEHLLATEILYVGTPLDQLRVAPAAFE